MAADFFLGESLVGDGNEVAHIDLIIGSKSGPAGSAFCNALANNKDGFTTLLAVVAPNLPAKPDTLLFNKVTIKGAKQAVQMFRTRPGRGGSRRGRSVASGVIPKDKADDLCVLVGVFIHWDASDDQKIYDYNYEATKESITRALGEQAERRRSDRRLEDGQASFRATPEETRRRYQPCRWRGRAGATFRRELGSLRHSCASSSCNSTALFIPACSIASSRAMAAPMTS